MASLEDVRRIVGDLPGSEEHASISGVTWSVRSQAFAWECRPWPSIPGPERAVIASELVLGVKVGDRRDAVALRQMFPDVFLAQTTRWSEPKVAFRMAGIALDHLTELVTEAWRVQAPKYLRRAFDESHPLD